MFNVSYISTVRLLLSFLIIPTLWIVSGFFVSFSIAWVGASDYSLYLYKSAHLLEEASEGHYFPLTDPVFIYSATIISVITFGLGTFLTSKVLANFKWQFALFPAFVYIVTYIKVFSFIWFGNYPSSVQLALLFELVFFTSAACLGYLLSKFIIEIPT